MPLARASAIAALVLGALTAADARAAYTFTNIVDSTTTPFIYGYEIDDATVAIQSRNEIFTVTGGVRTTIVEMGGPAPVGTFGLNAFITSVPSIGLSGQRVSFLATHDGGRDIFSGSVGPPTTIAKIGDATADGPLAIVSSITGTSLSNGNVAFLASYALTPPFTARGLFVGNGGALTTIVKQGDAISSGTLNSIGEPAIDGDRVAFTAQFSGGSGIFTGNGGALTTIVKAGDPAPLGNFLGMLTIDRPAISGNRVAFRAVYGPNLGIFTGNGGPLTTIAKTGDAAPTGVFIDLGKGPRTDIGYDGDRVAFFGTYTGGGTGVFVGNGGPITTVIKSGDQLFGQALHSLFPSNRVGLDPGGSGNIVFSYRLANGVTGVAMATPVPEPGTISLAATMLARISRRRFARKPA